MSDEQKESKNEEAAEEQRTEETHKRVTTSSMKWQTP